jgi:hypothetical protein
MVIAGASSNLGKFDLLRDAGSSKKVLSIKY